MDKKEILIVDDEQDTLSVLEKALTLEGYSVITATSAKALNAALLLEGPKLPDLIILDLALPDNTWQRDCCKAERKPQNQGHSCFVSKRPVFKETRSRNWSYP